jgi:excisionase family DNA binding protein
VSSNESPVPARPTAPHASRPALANHLNRPAHPGRANGQSSPNPEPSPGTRWVTAAYAASVLGLSKMSIYRLIHTGKLAHTTIDGAFRIPLTALEAHLSGKNHRFGEQPG